MAEDNEFAIWTASIDYFATGEGRTMMARISYARDAEDARQQFGNAFDPYYAQGCTLELGVARNPVTLFLWSTRALEFFEALDSRGAIEANSSFHFNLS